MSDAREKMRRLIEDLKLEAYTEGYMAAIRDMQAFSGTRQMDLKMLNYRMVTGRRSFEEEIRS